MPGIWRTSSKAGIERITTGRNLLGVMPTQAHCYRVGSTLIDAGAPRQADRLVEHLGDEITHVLLTHAHEDHVGAAAHLAERGARVYAPEPVLDVLRDPPELPYFRAWTWGEANPVEAEALGGRVETPDGAFEVVATPGHSPHHVALHEPDEGWVFTGDAFLGRREEHRFAEALDPMLDSLERLAKLDAQRLFPGHGRVRDEPSQALADTLDFYEDLLDRAAELRAEGHHVQGVRRELLGAEGGLTAFTGGEFSKTNLAQQLLTSRRLPD